MIIILQAVYLMIPAYLANMSPVLLSFLPFGARPVDNGAVWCSRRIFGRNKTYRGMVSGIIGGIAGTFLQKYLSPYTQGIALINYDVFSLGRLMIFGAAIGAGALIGDLLKSFFKRRMGIAEGKPWIPFDQLDFVVGALVAMSFFFVLPLVHIIIIVAVSPLLSLITNIIAYHLKIKKVWW